MRTAASRVAQLRVAELCQARRSVLRASARQRRAQQLACWLRENVDRLDYGCWDYADDPEEARRDFDAWCRGLRQAEGARRTPSMDSSTPLDSMRYVTVTMAFLLRAGSRTERALAECCRVPRDELWTRPVFSRLLGELQCIDFGDVDADVTYAMPNEPAYALTASDLADAVFDYLRPLK